LCVFELDSDSAPSDSSPTQQVTIGVGVGAATSASAASSSQEKESNEKLIEFAMGCARKPPVRKGKRTQEQNDFLRSKFNVRLLNPKDKSSTSASVAEEMKTLFPEEQCLSKNQISAAFSTLQKQVSKQAESAAQIAEEESIAEQPKKKSNQQRTKSKSKGGRKNSKRTTAPISTSKSRAAKKFKRVHVLLPAELSTSSFCCSSSASCSSAASSTYFVSHTASATQSDQLKGSICL